MFYQVGGTRLFSMTLGSGPDLLLLHPTPLDHSFWLPVAERLQDRFRVTLPDFRGHGQSELGKDGISIEGLARDVLERLDIAGIDRALFGGCSIGSYVLYELWRQAPSRVAGLALCCGKPQPDSAQGRANRIRNIEKIRENGVGQFLDQSLLSLSSAAFRERAPEEAQRLRAMMEPMSAESVIAVQEALKARPDSVATLGSISVPVLALAGSEDAASTPEEMKAIPEHIPAAEYHLVEGAGHFAPYEQPEIVGRILSEFFSKAQSSSKG